MIVFLVVPLVVLYLVYLALWHVGSFLARTGGLARRAPKPAGSGLALEGMRPPSTATLVTRRPARTLSSRRGRTGGRRAGRG